MRFTPEVIAAYAASATSLLNAGVFVAATVAAGVRKLIAATAPTPLTDEELDARVDVVMANATIREALNRAQAGPLAGDGDSIVDKTL